MNVTWTDYAAPNITGMFEAMEYINSTTEQMFVTSMAFAIWSIFFLMFSKHGVGKAGFASSLIMSVLSTLLYFGGLVGNVLPMSAIAATAVCAFFVISVKE